MPRNNKSHKSHSIADAVFDGTPGHAVPRKQSPIRLPVGFYERDYGLYADNDRGTPIELMSRIELSVSPNKHTKLGKTLSIASIGRAGKVRRVTFTYSDLKHRPGECTRRLRGQGVNIIEGQENLVMEILAAALMNSEVRK